MTDEKPFCASAYSPGRAVVMTSPLASALTALRQETEELPGDASSRTVEALLVQLEQILERTSMGRGQTGAAAENARAARHALNSGDVTLAADALREAAHAVQPI